LGTDFPSSAARLQAKPPRNPLRLLKNADIILLLFLNSIVCAIYYGFITSLPTLFIAAYPFLYSTTIGTCYLAIGGGMAIGAWANGKYLDWEYARVLEKLELLEEKGTDSEDLARFPFEQVQWACSIVSF
jgi:predicted MFS family arabinose efflux permease